METRKKISKNVFFYLLFLLIIGLIAIMRGAMNAFFVNIEQLRLSTTTWYTVVQISNIIIHLAEALFGIILIAMIIRIFKQSKSTKRVATFIAITGTLLSVIVSQGLLLIAINRFVQDLHLFKETMMIVTYTPVIVFLFVLCNLFGYKHLLKLQKSKTEKKSSEKEAPGKGFIAYVSIIIIFTIVLAATVSIPKDSEDTNELENIIYEGKGIKSIKIRDNFQNIIKLYGEPEIWQESTNTVWISYREKRGIDFLLSKENYIITEIRFNVGYEGALSNGISIGSSLADVLNASGGAKKTVSANYYERQNLVYGTDNVLYEQFGNDGTVTSYWFINSQKGILFVFDTNKTVVQITVYAPY